MTTTQAASDDLATLDLELQALTLDVGSTTSPRQPYGGPLLFEHVVVAADGTFEISIPTLVIPAETDPIFGVGAVVQDAMLSGQLRDDGSWCGTATGLIVSPTRFDVSGSTFAATPYRGALPTTFPSSCPD